MAACVSASTSAEAANACLWAEFERRRKEDRLQRSCRGSEVQRILQQVKVARCAAVSQGKDAASDGSCQHKRPQQAEALRQRAPRKEHASPSPQFAEGRAPPALSQPRAPPMRQPSQPALRNPLRATSDAAERAGMPRKAPFATVKEPKLLKGGQRKRQPTDDDATTAPYKVCSGMMADEDLCTSSDDSDICSVPRANDLKQIPQIPSSWTSDVAKLQDAGRLLVWRPSTEPMPIRGGGRQKFAQTSSTTTPLPLLPSTSSLVTAPARSVSLPSACLRTTARGLPIIEHLIYSGESPHAQGQKDLEFLYEDTDWRLVAKPVNGRLLNDSSVTKVTEDF